jgi:CheY-like chemotaxis protein/two-component sensor histidine kinase
MKVEEALRQSQKMEAIGQLTGGVAHDFNNLLTVIFGNLETARRRAEIGSGDLQRPLDAALRGAERAATMTQRLLAFSRRQPLAPKPLNLNTLVAGASELLQRTLGEKVAIETTLGTDLWWVSVDQNQLENAILNLAVNARDAMPAGGTLRIETGNRRRDGRPETGGGESDAPPGDYVMLAVSDTGTGIPQEIVDKVFEPFFTTKDIGQGTGLGLSQVYGFVKQSGGHVTIASEPGSGTTVSIYLPRLGAGAPGSEGRRQGTAAPAGLADRTILVVEDDDDVRAHTAALLRELGYRIVEAPGGAAALRLLEDEAVDLLFTDLGLPGGMNGRELAEAARRKRPGLKTLFTTGYAREGVADGAPPGEIELVLKPFTFAALAERIRRAIEAPPD